MDYRYGMNALSPLVSEFETVEQADAYLRWLETKVARSLADGRPTIPHDEVMARVQAIIGKASGKQC